MIVRISADKPGSIGFSASMSRPSKFEISASGKDELKLFRILFLAYRTKHNDFGRGDGFLTYKGEVLGRNEKETAEMLANNNNYEDMRISILLDDTLK